MDENNSNLLLNEIRSFFDSVTRPYLDKLSDSDKEKAVSWSQRIMKAGNYVLTKKFLILLTYMIVSGYIVSPFDADPRTCKLPSFESDLNEISVFNFIQNEIKRSKRNSDQNVAEAEYALSNDDKAFLAQLPLPNGGIRMYLAASTEPFSTWSKPDNFPVPKQYNVSSQDFVGESLGVVKRRFSHYEDKKKPRRLEFPIEGPYKIVQVDFEKAMGNSSLESLDSIEPPLTSEQERYRCIMDIPPNLQVLVDKRDGKILDNLLDSTPILDNDVARQREEQVQKKLSRWFGQELYDPYRELITKLLRKNVSIDTIRRNVHKCMKRHFPSEKCTPMWLRDSLDDKEPRPLRIAHLKMRLADVLKNDYGVDDDEELYYVTTYVDYGENEVRKVRKLLQLAEEGRINANVRRMITTGNRSCEVLSHYIDYLLMAAEEMESCYEEPCRRRQSSTGSSNYPDSQESAEPVVSVNRPSSTDAENPNVRYPEGRQPTPRELPGSSTSQNENRSNNQDTSQRSRSSRDSKSFNLEDVTSEQLFGDLPPDTSTESASSDKSRKKRQKK